MWPFRKLRTGPLLGEPVVDLDQDPIRIGDHRDPSSLLMTLSMTHGAAFLRWDTAKQQHLVTVKERTFAGDTQLEALSAAWEGLKS